MRNICCRSGVLSALYKHIQAITMKKIQLKSNVYYVQGCFDCPCCQSFDSHVSDKTIYTCGVDYHRLDDVSQLIVDDQCPLVDAEEGEWMIEAKQHNFLARKTLKPETEN